MTWPENYNVGNGVNVENNVNEDVNYVNDFLNVPTLWSWEFSTWRIFTRVKWTTRSNWASSKHM